MQKTIDEKSVEKRNQQVTKGKQDEKRVTKSRLLLDNFGMQPIPLCRRTHTFQCGWLACKRLRNTYNWSVIHSLCCFDIKLKMLRSHTFDLPFIFSFNLTRRLSSLLLPNQKKKKKITKEIQLDFFMVLFCFSFSFSFSLLFFYYLGIEQYTK